MIHVCFGLHDADGLYSKFTGTTITSIFANTSEQVTAHILHDATLIDYNRENFLRLAKYYNQRVEFHNVDELCPNEIQLLREVLAERIKTRFSIGTFYRLLAKKILPVDRIIYLDSDIIVNLDIGELWNVDLRDYPLAAVPEVAATQGHMIKNKFLLNAGLVAVEDYFNSGVILFNLNRLDENFFADGVKFLVDNPQCASPDQDILNAFFAKNYLKLENRFDSFVSTEESKPAEKIYHYAGHVMDFDMEKPFSLLWMANYMNSGWFDIDSIDRIYINYLERDAEVKNTLIQVTSALNGNRKRAFVTFAAYVDAIKQIFDAADNELIVIETFLDFDELIRALKKVKSKRVFFSMVENFTIMSNIFSDMGLVEGKDFFNGLKFLAAQHGYRINSYSFVKAL
ncbi:MAG: hypothetical protein IJ774_04005 [Selenomonadaceae bacterium]|nr:hypothetical protein [Selenomonadaceae bacterium]